MGELDDGGLVGPDVGELDDGGLVGPDVGELDDVIELDDLVGMG